MLISTKKLKELLINQNHISEEDFNRSEQTSIETGMELDKLLVEQGFIKDEVLGKLMAEELNYDFIDLKNAHFAYITPRLLSYIPEVVAFAQKTIAFEETEQEIHLATADPSNYVFFKLLEKRTGKRVKVFLASSFDIEQALKRYKGDLRQEAISLLKETEKDPTKKETNIVKLVNLFLEYAYSNLASDIHLEPLSGFMVVRFRIDGILHKVAEYPKDLHNRIVTRVKIMAKLRTDERAAPQDGNFNFQSAGSTIDVRVSIMPTTEGEKIVMRLLMPRTKRFFLNELGFSEKDLKRIKSMIDKPYGTILAVGPTGSGKTTTLYAILQSLNKPEVNIMTIEDPVEYNVEGVYQTQINLAKNVTFATGLRSIVRQDPNIIMVGEMRDEETVSMGINAAMTGHLVLSSLHTNDAATTFPRLLELKAKPFLVASSIDVVVAQRLVRMICQDCIQEYYLSAEQIGFLEQDKNLTEIIKKVSGEKDLSKIKFFKGKGCKLCNNNGYIGRTGVFEVLEASEAIRSLVLKKASSTEIKNQAVKEGMTTMLEDTVAKALKGITSLDELRKTVKS